MPHVHNPMETKPAIKSFTVQGAVIAAACMIVSKLWGIHIPTDHAKELFAIAGDIPTDWALLTTAVAGLGTRLVKWDFDKSLLKSKTWWFALGSAVFALLQVFGVDTAALVDFSTTVQALIAKYLPAAASIWMLIGATKAKKAIIET